MSKTTPEISFIGPGLLVAAAGIGAGDMIIGIQLGLDFNLVFLAAVIIAALLKYVLTEGIARYQLTTGHRVINAWSQRFPKVVFYLFFAFFLIWSVMVSAALMSACGLAGNALFPGLSVGVWGVIHGLTALAIVYLGKYELIEDITKWLIGIMFLIVIITAIYLWAFVPPGHLEHAVSYDRSTLILAILGGVGGSVTMLSYGYWLDEKGWNNKTSMGIARKDLGFSYAITAVFVLSVMVIASRLDLDGNELTGSALVLGLSSLMGTIAGSWMDLLFKICFWGVVFSSMVTVWSGVPYLFSDFLQNSGKSIPNEKVDVKGKTYRSYLIFMTLAPMVVTLGLEAVRNVVNYTLISSVFVIGLALTLIYINNQKKWMADMVNRPWTNILLFISALAFALIGFYSLFH